MRWAAAALVVIPVLAFDPWGWASFGPVKWGLASSTALLLVTFVAMRGRVTVHRTSAAGWGLFLLWGVVVAALAVDPVHTWIGTPDRHLGWVAWVLFAVAYIAGQQMERGESVVAVLRAASVALAGTGVYVLLELVDLAPVELAATASRAGGPFGSAAYLGAACALLLPIVVGHAADPVDTVRWRWVAGVAGAVGAVAALAAQTRAGWVGLAAAAVVAAPAVAGWLRRHLAVAAGIAVAAVLALALTPAGSRVASAFDFADGAARGRIDEWQVGLAVLGNHPVTGVGFEGYRIAFSEGVDADYEQRYGREVMPDRAHNGALDVGVTTGLPGVVLYVGAALWLGAVSIAGIRTGRPWIVGVGAGVVGYLVQQQFLFPLAELDLVFWLFAGMLVGTVVPTVTIVRVPAAVWIGAAVLAGSALVAGVLDVAADHAAAGALDDSSRGAHAAALGDAERAVGLRPDSIRYRVLAAGVAAAAGTPDGYATAVHQLERGLDVSPRDPILLAERASARLSLARATRDGSELRRAIEEWEALLAVDPFHARYWLEAGIGYRIAGDDDAAADAWVRAADLAPRSPAPHANLALLSLELGRADEAAAALAALAAIDPADPRLPELQRRLEALVDAEKP